jgi:hypothetical protein
MNRSAALTVNEAATKAIIAAPRSPATAILYDPTPAARRGVRCDSVVMTRQVPPLVPIRADQSHQV